MVTSDTRDTSLSESSAQIRNAQMNLRCFSEGTAICYRNSMACCAPQKDSISLYSCKIEHITNRVTESESGRNWSVRAVYFDAVLVIEYLQIGHSRNLSEDNRRSAGQNR